MAQETLRYALASSPMIPINSTFAIFALHGITNRASSTPGSAAAYSKYEYFYSANLQVLPKSR
jgi:hypothetical protein